MSKAKLKQQESTWIYIQEPSIPGQKESLTKVASFIYAVATYTNYCQISQNDPVTPKIFTINNYSIIKM